MSQPGSLRSPGRPPLSMRFKFKFRVKLVCERHYCSHTAGVAGLAHCGLPSQALVRHEPSESTLTVRFHHASSLSLPPRRRRLSPT